MKKLLIILFLFSGIISGQGTLVALIQNNQATTPIIPPPASGDAILTNFRVVPSQLKRIYYDSSSDETGMTATGFVVTDKTVDSVNTVSNYLIVDSDFTYWDNATVRLSSGSGEALDFALKHVDNQVSEPTSSGSTYYVTTSGSNGNTGLSEGQAWLTLTYAVAQISAGDVIYVKAGTYTGELIDINAKSGTSTNPIKIIGYKSTINDISSNYMTYGSSLSATEMPLIDSGNRNNGNKGWDMNNSDYWVIKNIQIKNYQHGVWTGGTSGSDHNVFERVNVTDIGNTANNVSSLAFSTDGNKGGVDSYNKLLDCYAENAVGALYRTFGNKNLVLGCRGYADDNSTGDISATDYYISLYSGSGNVVKDSYVERVGALTHTGHGISIKADAITSEYNLFENNTTVNIKQAIQLRHSQSRYNVARGNDISGTDGTITIRDGSSENIIEGNYVHGTAEAIRYYETSEDGTNPVVGFNNTFRNNIFENCGIWIAGVTNATTGTIEGNLYYNNTIINSSPLFSSVHTIDNTNLMTNNIILTTAVEGTNSSVYDSNLFYGGFAAKGTNQITTNPSLTVSFVPTATLTSIDVTPIASVKLDYNRNLRNATLTTVGAIKHANETP